MSFLIRKPVPRRAALRGMLALGLTSAVFAESVSAVVGLDFAMFQSQVRV